jgi:transposase
LVGSPIDGFCFTAWFGQFLVPAMRPEQIIFMDDAGYRKVHAVRTGIKASGARLRFLLPYPPDLNPVKQSFSTIK